MLINKNKYPIINNKTLFKGQQFYFCLVEEIWSTYLNNPSIINVRLDKIYVRAEIKINDLCGDYRNILCKGLSLIIDEKILKENNKSYLLFTKNGQQTIIATNKQDVLNYVKKLFYSKIHNPWSNTTSTYNLRQMYNKTLVKLKCL